MHHSQRIAKHRQHVRQIQQASNLTRQAGVRKVNYWGYAGQLALDIAKHLMELLNRYPVIKNNIKWISTSQARNEREKVIIIQKNIDYYINQGMYQDTPENRQALFTYFNGKITARSIEDNVFAESTGPKFGELQGICFNRYWSLDYEKLAKAYEQTVRDCFSPQGSFNPLCIFTHEFGHQIDEYLKTNNLRTGIDQLWQQAILSYNKDNDYFKKNLCVYASMNSEEFLAEGFTEYIHSKSPRPLAQDIGKAIESVIR